jgi:aquaporin Z
MTAGLDDGRTSCAQSLSEPLETQGGKLMADVITNQEATNVVAAPQQDAASRTYTAAPHPELGTASRKYAVEVIGTFFLTFVVAMSVLSGSVFTPLAAGATLMVMIYAGGHISGGHYNPAVTMAVLVRGRIGIGDAVAYWIAQVVGGVIAGVLARAVVNPATVKTLTLTGHTEAAAAVVELLITFALCYVVLNVATSRDQPGNSFFGLAIGFTVAAGAFAVGGISGGAFNPAVTLGAATAGLFAWSTIWVYLVVQLGAGVAAALAFRALNPGDK